MVHAIFKIRGSIEPWLIAKKKDGEITQQNVADTYNEKFGGHKIWACDIEDLEQVIDKDEVKKLFGIIKDECKLFM